MASEDLDPHQSECLRDVDCRPAGVLVKQATQHGACGSGRVCFRARRLHAVHPCCHLLHASHVAWSPSVSVLCENG